MHRMHDNTEHLPGKAIEFIAQALDTCQQVFSCAVFFYYMYVTMLILLIWLILLILCSTERGKTQRLHGERMGDGGVVTSSVQKKVGANEVSVNAKCR